MIRCAERGRHWELEVGARGIDRQKQLELVDLRVGLALLVLDQREAIRRAVGLGHDLEHERAWMAVAGELVATAGSAAELGFPVVLLRVGENPDIVGPSTNRHE